jgi:hypothetical protein
MIPLSSIILGEKFSILINCCNFAVLFTALALAQAVKREDSPSLKLWRTVSDGVTGNTSGFGPEESRFEPWSDNSKRKDL